jgi:hypothetical protein
MLAECSLLRVWFAPLRHHCHCPLSCGFLPSLWEPGAENRPTWKILERVKQTYERSFHSQQIISLTGELGRKATPWVNPDLLTWRPWAEPHNLPSQLHAYMFENQDAPKREINSLPLFELLYFGAFLWCQLICPQVDLVDQICVNQRLKCSRCYFQKFISKVSAQEGVLGKVEFLSCLPLAIPHHTNQS